jgi:hypothetical protein
VKFACFRFLTICPSPPPKSRMDIFSFTVPKTSAHDQLKSNAPMSALDVLQILHGSVGRAEAGRGRRDPSFAIK